VNGRRGAGGISREAGKTAEECKAEDENPMNKVKELGTAGLVTFTFWELAFWILGGAGAAAAYYYAKGHTPDFSNQEELAEVGGEAFVFINAARALVPLRIGLVVGTTPWVDENIMKKFFPKAVDEECEVAYQEEDAQKKEMKKTKDMQEILTGSK